jgi:hypothetical protein|tara:strand:+ start:1708 stop:2091 length:384 start_codon:yes stop_codon:yes gene_type:complete
MKKCSKCKKVKENNCFNLDRRALTNLQSHCRDCQGQYLNRYKIDYGLGAGTISRYGFRLALEVYERCNRRCVECGEENDLTIHHLDNQGRNYENKGLKVNNDKDNLIVLCRKCHGGLHSREYWANRK